jgi:hypothetical protein
MRQETVVRMLATCLAGWGMNCGSATTTEPDDGATVDAPPTDADAETVADVEPETEAETDADAGRPVGAHCNLAEQCADGLVPGECLTMIWAIEAPDGYCTGLGCHEAADCPGGADVAVCAELYAGINVCLARCGIEDDCRTTEGYHCLDPDQTGPIPNVCLPFCTTAGGCPGGQSCHTGGRPPLCHESAGAVNGQPCEHHADCAAGSYCLAERALFGGWPQGYCTQDCRSDAVCSNGGVCVLSCSNEDDNLLNDPCNDDGTPGSEDPSNLGICMESCVRGTGSCPRPGYVCKSVGPGSGHNLDVCAPDCGESAGGCGGVGWTCDPFAGVFIGGATYGYGRCQPPLDETALGGTCQVTSGCRGAFCISESLTGYPQGLCAEECGLGDPCPTGFECTGGGLLAGLCFRPCTVGVTECRPGTRCADLGWGVITCVPDCQSNADCDNTCCHQDVTGYCDPTRQYCML